MHIQDEPPNWNSDLEAGMESISEPDIDLPEEDDEFSDAQEELRSASASPDTSLPSTNSKTDEDDAEEDPLDPVTQGMSKISFKNIRAPGHMQKAPSTSTTGSSATDSLDFEDEEDEEWLAPEVFTPQPEYGILTPVIEPPTLEESQITVTRGSGDHSPGGEADLEKRKRKSKKKGKDAAVPVQFPFPATAGEEEEMKNSGGGGKRVPQMRTQKARDGGRTQSGGVRGIPTDDFDDF